MPQIVGSKSLGHNVLAFPKQHVAYADELLLQQQAQVHHVPISILFDLRRRPTIRSRTPNRTTMTTSHRNPSVLFFRVANCTCYFQSKKTIVLQREIIGKVLSKYVWAAVGSWKACVVTFVTLAGGYWFM